ncbi:MAG: hypothetical protein PF961_14615 [Planctomycetota bacterium]|jgi:beta-glucuronidase|nr:hypothetical protein [Planctomycetota bacterium]
MDCYPRFPQRRIHRLDGLWDLACLSGADIATVDVDYIRYQERVAVPGCLDQLGYTPSGQGVAAFRCMLDARGGAVLRGDCLQPGTRVFVDGQRLQLSGQAPWQASVAPSADGHERELVLLVPWTSGTGSIGVPGAVQWHEVGAWWLDGLDLCQLACDGTASVRLRCAGQAPPQIDCFVSVDGGPEQVVPEVALNHGAACFTVLVPDASPWQPEGPNLHLIRVRVGAEEIEQRFGFAAIRCGDGMLYCNDAVLHLRLCDWHGEHPAFGRALPLAQLRADLALVQGLGCNALRLHCDRLEPRLLDLCDELGVVVVLEAAGWDQPNVPRSMAAVIAETAEAMQRAAAHACVIAYAVPYLAAQGAAGMGFSDQLTRRLRDLLPPRPVVVTWDGCGPVPDQGDAIVLEPDQAIGDEDPAEWLQAHLLRAGNDGRPVVVAGVGSSGRLGWRGRGGEEAQAESLEQLCAAAVAEPRLAGLGLASLSDHLDANGVPIETGCFDRYRQPKLAAAAVRRCWLRGERALA